MFEEKGEVRKTRKKQLVGDVTKAAAEEISINTTFQHSTKREEKKALKLDMFPLYFPLVLASVELGATLMSPLTQNRCPEGS